MGPSLYEHAYPWFLDILHSWASYRKFFHSKMIFESRFCESKSRAFQRYPAHQNRSTGRWDISLRSAKGNIAGMLGTHTVIHWLSYGLPYGDPRKWSEFQKYPNFDPILLRGYLDLTKNCYISWHSKFNALSIGNIRIGWKPFWSIENEQKKKKIFFLRMFIQARSHFKYVY